MQLVSFRVQDFRSVIDSGWIEVDRVTALIGTNESGKTNLLLPLWKLNPATDGAIDAIVDYPRNKYNIIKNQKVKPIFISVKFTLDEDLAEELALITGTPVEQLAEAIVQRDYDGDYFVQFPFASPSRETPVADINALLKSAISDIDGSVCLKGEETRKTDIISELRKGMAALNGLTPSIHRDALKDFIATLPQADLETATKKSVIAPRLSHLNEKLAEMLAAISQKHPNDIKKAVELILERIPYFVYYSNYGNLDSEIYLPHVIENLTRKGLGSKEAAKARTLKVLFDFVNLKPEEIQELGEDVEAKSSSGRLSDEEIAATARKKKERDVLLQSAGGELTNRFKEWWKQGDYRFRFQADGDHFRIWVSDDRRPDDIELENRSTGLQWFLSFFLIFLVESLDAHKNSVLLLDEPGLSLHPLAQEDLSRFFEGLSESNQLIYTTHSPFLVDADHLERVKAVYVGDDGSTQISTDLKAADQKSPESRSIYPVYAALGLSISRTLLLGCKTIIVEGTSDQFYLSAIKTILIAKGIIKPAKEIIFVPAWGVRGVKAVVSIVTGLDEELPHVVLDSDEAGRTFHESLGKTVYDDSTTKVVMVGTFAPVDDNAEVEDLFPQALVAKVIDRSFRSETDKDFSDVVVTGKPIIPQIEAFALENGIALQHGWKVDLARQAKQRILKDGIIDPTILTKWENLFIAMGI